MFRWLRERLDDYEGSRAEVFTTPVAHAQPGEPARRANAVVRPESRDPGFAFEVHLVVHYGIRTGTTVEDPFLVARAGVDRRVRAVARQYSLTECARVRPELELALSRQAEVESTGVFAWASCVGVYAPKQSFEVIERYEELRRQETVRDWERKVEEAEIKHLGRLLGDPARATAWWWRSNPEAVRQLPEVAQTFKTLRYELSEHDRPSGDGGDSWDDVFAEFHQRADAATRYLLTEQMRRILKDHDLGDLADRAGLLHGDERGD